MEGQELQGDDAEDALQTVHSVWQLEGVIGILHHLRVVLATKDDGPTLVERESRARTLTLVTGSMLLQRLHSENEHLFQVSRCVFFQDLPIWQ